MLGVRRPGVTLALQTLEAAKFIRNRRGCITVLNRPKLVEIAGPAYTSPHRHISDASRRPGDLTGTVPIPSHSR